MRKLVCLILLISFISGCKSSIRTNFNNFNAYYNTFYNAKKNYRLGVDKSEGQTRKYNPLQPIRIYETPLGAGSSEFQSAIDKGADILRKYEESKWVDDALEIIGKAYFYRGEYFSADQKFDELYVSSKNDLMKQRAVFWKGRVFLELELYTQGIQYLDDQLAEIEKWDGGLNYEVTTILAELYVERENWNAALDLLNESVDHLPKKEYKERGYFLIGQLNELLGDLGGAFRAYDKVQDHYTKYELQFEAKKKKAEVARKLGNSEDAYKVFSSMVRDDKNTSFVAELKYELGRTEQERGNAKEAEKIYLSILSDKIERPEPKTKALVYNALAEIYRFTYNDFKLAATYYDSASTIKIPEAEIPEGYNAKDLAVSFGEYSKLKSQIHEQDSLLKLGLLPKEEFDSVLVELENKRRAEIEKQIKDQENKQNTFINLAAGENNKNDQSNEKSGFLNVKSPVLLADASQQFKGLWGNRPLVDNWRVASIMAVAELNDSTNSNQALLNEGQGTEEIFVSIDISRVPFTKAAQDSVREEIAEDHYELGNLFFLSLDIPDSAIYYFNLSLSEVPDSKVAPVSMYSLSEVHSIQNDDEKALEIAKRLVDKYPNSVYADRLVERYELERVLQEEEEVLSLLDKYNLINEDSLSQSDKADKLADLAQDNPATGVGALALYDAIEIYMKLGTKDSTFRTDFDKWQNAHDDFNVRVRDLKQKQDSVKSIFSDTLQVITPQDSLYYSELLDSSITRPDYSTLFPYYGANWDSTRSKITSYKNLFPKGAQLKKVTKLENELKVPEKEEEQVQSEETQDEQPEEKSEYLKCEDIDQELFIRGGRDNFMRSVTIPEGVRERRIIFLFYVNQRGIIDEFKLASNNQNQELIDNFITAIDNGLSFEPVLVQGEAKPVQCRFEFPVR